MYPRVMGIRTIIDIPIWWLTVLTLNSYDDWNFQKMASYEKFIKDQLKNYMKPDTDSKLQTFAKCYEEFKIQPYLNNNLQKINC